MKNTRILIVEAHPVSREEINSILQTDPDFEVVGTAFYTQEALAMNHEFQPDIVLLDLKTLGAQSAELISMLYQDIPQIKVLTMSDHWDDACVHDLAAVGVLGFVDKTELPEKIVNAIHAVADGNIWFSQAALEQLIDKGNEAVPVEDFGLTDRELDVIRLTAVGKTNREIALVLEISVKTIEKCLTIIYEKLGVRSRVETAVWAVRSGLV
ncbi:MAG: response regulator transcription factor [Ardenticatenaceae bacterium]|nr:response regulator transcription factor [Ardenticatenaceae bacterium]MCB9443794.1 response regulator transcription factor [Ardenticatenaceae bacterium]